MNPVELTQRIADLEIRLAFQDKTIEELNAVVTEQATAIARLEQGFALLRDKMATITPSQEVANEPPPHY